MNETFKFFLQYENQKVTQNLVCEKTFLTFDTVPIENGKIWKGKNFWMEFGKSIIIEGKNERDGKWCAWKWKKKGNVFHVVSYEKGWNGF